MTWIFIEGIDRTGKSTVCELYKKQGYEVVHFSAPNKKYSQKGYTGPSYLDEVLELYMSLGSKDVVFDRSPYGELVWPRVYNRPSQLTDEDIMVLRDLEKQNNAKYILMHDPDMAGHWKRCVANKEPMDREQFKAASGLFIAELNSKYGFQMQTLADYKVHFLLDEDLKKKTEAELTKSVSSTVDSQETNPAPQITAPPKTPEQSKLERANAINDILSKRIVKGKGPVYENIENSIRSFLNTELGRILGQSNDDDFNSKEIEVLKAMVKRMLDKADTGLATNKEKYNGTKRI